MCMETRNRTFIVSLCGNTVKRKLYGSVLLTLVYWCAMHRWCELAILHVTLLKLFFLIPPPFAAGLYNTHEEMLDACRHWQLRNSPPHACFIRPWVLELQAQSTKIRRTRDIHRIVWHVRKLWHSSICLSQCPLYIDFVHSAGWFASEMPLQLWPVLMKAVSTGCLIGPRQGRPSWQTIVC